MVSLHDDTPSRDTPSPSSQPSPPILTRGELAAAGYVAKSVKAEIRDNLLVAMAAGEDRFPGIIGFTDTVLPQLERALLAGHDMVLLGERGQGKTRL
ncbi:MAG: magnesium chelatase subunit, partial [Frankiales bacterium]|nr:magnesium chelatase subunit [Frankiales bacterium]